MAFGRSLTLYSLFFGLRSVGFLLSLILIFSSIILVGCEIKPISGFYGLPSYPPITYTGEPSHPSLVTVLDITVGGTNVTTYQYKVGVSASTDCTSAAGYSIATPIATHITDNISALADGLLKLCIAKKSSALSSSSDYAEYTWLKDTTVPVAAGAVADGVYYNSVAATPTLTWAAATDTGGSGVSHYELALGTTLGGTELLSWVNIGNVTSYQRTGLTLTDGATYYASVRAVDAATNTSTVMQSDGWVIETVLPTAPTNFSDGSMSTSLTDSPIFYWTASTDAHSGLNSYVIAIGTTAGGTDVMNWVNVGNVTSYQVTGLTLTAGALYYGSIKALDNAGNNSAVVQGNGWRVLGTQKVVDTVQPQVRMASAGSNYGADVVVSANGLTMAVSAYADNLDASGSNYLSAAGAVFMYIYSGGTWQFQQKIVGLGINGRLANDYFGGSIALGGETGDTLAIGVSSHDYDPAGANYLASAGAVFIFTRAAGVWSLQQKIVGEGTNGRLAGDGFGISVALGDSAGDTLAIGAFAQGYDGAGANYVGSSGAVYIFTRAAGTWSLQQKVVGEGTNGRLGADYFGYKVALSRVGGDTLAAVAYGQNYDGAGANYKDEAGAVFIFTRVAGAWSLQQKVAGEGPNSRPATFDPGVFGDSMALGGTNGDTLAVAACEHDYDEAGANHVSDAGAVFVFTRSGSTWSFQQKIVATGTNGRTSGTCLYSATFGDSNGDTLAIGAPGHDYDAAGANYLYRSGAVFIFTRAAGVWSLQQKVVGEGTNGRLSRDDFGSSVALGGPTGDTLATGANGQDYDATGANAVDGAGAVFISTRSGSTWTQQQKIVDTVQPQVRMASANTGYGSGIAVSADGLTMAVAVPQDVLDASGANYVGNAGSVFTYIYSSGSWQFQQKIVATGTNSRLQDDFFGYSLALGGTTGDTLAVGSYLQDYDATGANYLVSAGAVYIFTRSGSTWSQQQKIVGTGTNGRMATDQFGYSVALGGLTGDTLAVGSYRHGYDAAGTTYLVNSGATFIFTRSGSTWSLQQKIVGTGTNGRMGGDYFGYSVALGEASGDTLAVGSYLQDYDAAGANYLDSAGAVYIFTRSGSTWSQQQKIVGTGTNGRVGSDYFGGPLALGGTNGDTLAVGVWQHDYDVAGINLLSNAGAVFVFTKTAGVWSQQEKLVGTGINGRLLDDYFGYSVALGGAAGDTLAVGARLQDYDTTGTNYVGDSGAAYLFTRSAGTWSLQQKIVGTGTNSRLGNDNFGYSVALGGAAADTLAVGASRQDYDASGANYVLDAGAVFVYH